MRHPKGGHGRRHETPVRQAGELGLKVINPAEKSTRFLDAPHLTCIYSHLWTIRGSQPTGGARPLASASGSLAVLWAKKRKIERRLTFASSLELTCRVFYVKSDR
jgi:hypothetical protein